MDCGYAISITILALATTPIALPVQFQLRLFLYPHCSTALLKRCVLRAGKGIPKIPKRMEGRGCDDSLKQGGEATDIGQYKDLWLVLHLAVAWAEASYVMNMLNGF
eukprot:scaffold5706_cov124-Isochrysis_galbana.AAC.9